MIRTISRQRKPGSAPALPEASGQQLDQARQFQPRERSIERCSVVTATVLQRIDVHWIESYVVEQRICDFGR